MRRRLVVLALLVIATPDCSDGPTAPSRACRKWPLRYSSGGATFTCDPSPTLPRCSAFPVNLEVTWSYRSQSDFVHEADVPNRVLALEKASQGCGTFVTTGCSTNLVKYEYDAQGRVVRRERSWSHSLGAGGTLDVATFTAWDRRGRPTQGRIEANGEASPLSIVYDDARRTAQASNGELVEQDPYGNVIREVRLQDGSPVETLYSIESFQDVCEAAP
jgi:hypothetical protein